MSSKTATINLLPKQVRKIKGYDKYYITPWGDIYSTWKGLKKLKPYKDSSGYLCVRLFETTKRGRMCRIHRLVANNYLGEGFSFLQVDHIDNNKLNNHHSNLRWVTQKENLLKKYREDGHKIHFSKKTAQWSLEDGRLVAIYPSGLDASKETGADSSAISKVCRGLLNQTKGYYWTYV